MRTCTDSILFQTPAISGLKLPPVNRIRQTELKHLQEVKVCGAVASATLCLLYAAKTGFVTSSAPRTEGAELYKQATTP